MSLVSGSFLGNDSTHLRYNPLPALNKAPSNQSIQKVDLMHLYRSLSRSAMGPRRTRRRLLGLLVHEQFAALHERHVDRATHLCAPQPTIHPSIRTLLALCTVACAARTIAEVASIEDAAQLVPAILLVCSSTHTHTRTPMHELLEASRAIGSGAPLAYTGAWRSSWASRRRTSHRSPRRRSTCGRTTLPQSELPSSSSKSSQQQQQEHRGPSWSWERCPSP